MLICIKTSLTHLFGNFIKDKLLPSFLSYSPWEFTLKCETFQVHCLVWLKLCWRNQLTWNVWWFLFSLLCLSLWLTRSHWLTSSNYCWTTILMIIILCFLAIQVNFFHGILYVNFAILILQAGYYDRPHFGPTGFDGGYIPQSPYP